MKLSSENLGKKCIYTSEYYNGKVFENKQYVAIIKTLLVNTAEGAYGYTISYEYGNTKYNVTLIDKSLHFTKNYIGEDINSISII